jgi:hypothetical protein
VLRRRVIAAHSPVTQELHRPGVDMGQRTEPLR